MAFAQNVENSTVEDIYALSDGERAELLDGQMYMQAAPGRQHQEVLGILYRRIADYIEYKNGICKIYPAPFAVFLNADDKNYVEPDISVICDREKLTDQGCKGAPDWVVEIVSPLSRYMDYLLKLLKYQSSGMREYWIVDVLKNRITVYNFENGSMEEYSLNDIVKAGIYEDLEIDFSKILLSLK